MPFVKSVKGRSYFGRYTYSQHLFLLYSFRLLCTKQSLEGEENAELITTSEGS